MSGGMKCYPGTDVLINKYNIKDKDLLDKLEIQKVTVKLLSLDTNPTRIKYSYDVKHLKSIHKFLFSDIYEWAGTYREENLFKSERVLSGGSAEYTDYKKIDSELKGLLSLYKDVDFNDKNSLKDNVLDFLLKLRSIHPFREGNTRTCITFIWHYLKGRGIDFRVELLRNNPMYVRDSLVMANYDQKEYLYKIINDALSDREIVKGYKNLDNSKEQYTIAKADYEIFREKYSIKKAD